VRLYQVGGAVRDRLLGVAHSDRDWVAVGATPEALLAQGYTPVGRDFPVFLHPRTHDEVALARTERKTAPGYRGFVVHADPSVTLEEDLRRRDLTINAIAEDEQGTLIDPFGGVTDLRAGWLRHVSEAFAEDPVRILRLARFAARWPHFRVAPQTLALCRRMVAAGEVDALVPERVWQELSRGLMEGQPSRMIAVLRECGALGRLLPEVERLWGEPRREERLPEVDSGEHLMRVLDMAARLHQPLPVRWACLVHALGHGGTPAERLAERWRVPADCRELGAVVARENVDIQRSASLDAEAMLRLLERCDALRRPERFEQVLAACECDARARAGLQDLRYAPHERLCDALRTVLAVDAEAVAAAARHRGATGPAIGDAVRAARLAALCEHLGQAR
jgi:tRNA nucleotidyltransferase (CCA-adding enzyme)